MALTIDNVRQFAIDWYRALDVHVPLADALEFLLDDGLEMRFPETTARGHGGFTDWYKAVTNRFFDEKHVVTARRRSPSWCAGRPTSGTRRRRPASTSASTATRAGSWSRTPIPS
jgi:hypothetical protein